MTITLRVNGEPDYAESTVQIPLDHPLKAGVLCEIPVTHTEVSLADRCPICLTGWGTHDMSKHHYRSAQDYQIGRVIQTLVRIEIAEDEVITHSTHPEDGEHRDEIGNQDDSAAKYMELMKRVHAVPKPEISIPWAGGGTIDFTFGGNGILIQTPHDAVVISWGDWARLITAEGRRHALTEMPGPPVTD